MEIGEKIALTASNFVGQTEIKGNLGFNDRQFEEMMKAVGWKRGEAWCAYFAELIWKLANVQEPAVNEELSKLFSGSTVQTWKNFLNSQWLNAEEPVKGAVAIWQKYKNGEAQWSGHAGIVVEMEGNKFFSVEGNTNDHGGREGYIVALKGRTYNRNTDNGLRLLGFIHPVKEEIDDRPDEVS